MYVHIAILTSSNTGLNWKLGLFCYHCSSLEKKENKSLDIKISTYISCLSIYKIFGNIEMVLNIEHFSRHITKSTTAWSSCQKSQKPAPKNCDLSVKCHNFSKFNDFYLVKKMNISIDIFTDISWRRRTLDSFDKDYAKHAPQERWYVCKNAFKLVDWY